MSGRLAEQGGRALRHRRDDAPPTVHVAVPMDLRHRRTEGAAALARVAVRLLAVALAVLLLGACAGKIPHTLKPEYKDAGIRLIAVLPVQGENMDPRLARLLREKVLMGLYFKGYPKIPLTLVDEKLATFYQAQTGAQGVVAPRVAGELLGIDAVLYISLVECRTAYRALYAQTTVAARLELRSARTGETLWRVQDREAARNFGFTSGELEMKSSEVCEAAMQTVVDRALYALPDGPDRLG